MDALNVFLRLATLLCAFRVSEQGPNERRLYHDLMVNYSVLERPVKSEEEKVTVEVGINVMQIIDVDEKNQVLTTNLWLQMSWEAYNLAWDQKEYPGVRFAKLPNHLLWKPDVVLYNSADERFDGTSHTNIVVTDTGHCTYISTSAILKSTCKIDMRWFPFDEQRCELTFGSWTHSGESIDLKMLDADLGNFMPNGEWDLVEVPGMKTDKTYSCCVETYPQITYTVVLRRRTLYYGLNLLIPCILISSLALLMFLLPADSGEKLTLGITVLLSLTVVMLLVAQIVPATSDTVPLISQYFATIMVIVGLSVIATVLVLQFHHHDPNGSKMPEWTRVFLLNWCARFLCMKRPGEDKVHPPYTCLSNVGIPLDSKPHSTAATSSDSGVIGGRLLRTGEEELLIPDTHGSTEQELGKILDEVRYITTRFRNQDQEEMVCNEWKFAASVIDRLCLMAFSVMTILCTIGILMSALN